jgi:antitoxin CptB
LTDATHTPAGQGSSCDPETRRLLWRCRRGMKELDLVLERFARGALPEASPQERAAFGRLLGLPDPLLAGYLLGTEHPAEPELAQLTGRIRELCIAGPVGAILPAVSGSGGLT